MNLKAMLTYPLVVSPRWRHLPPILTNDLFSRLLKALITRKWQEPLIDFPSKTAKIIVKKLNKFLTVYKGHHNRVMTLRKQQKSFLELEKPAKL
jgi:hypothetical protein